MSGQTSSSADTAATFRHGKNQVPSFWVVQTGDVYIPKDGVGPNTADVRSRRTSETFQLLLFFS